MLVISWRKFCPKGLDVSPAVRDYLGLCGIDVYDWKFGEFRESINKDFFAIMPLDFDDEPGDEGAIRTFHF
jgi:hypothetical protein